MTKSPINIFPHREHTTHGRLRLFAMHLDPAAAVRARWANSTMSQIAGENWIISTELWKVDSLEASPGVAKMLTEEAARADVVVIAASALNYRHYPVLNWLEMLGAFATTRQHTGLLIGLFGDEADQRSELNWTVNQFLQSAAPMNRDFIWRWMDAGAMREYSWLANYFRPFLNRTSNAAEESQPFAQQFAGV